ncbi:uncharacterized protein LOC117171621 isoform X2 [Belonocnema kinseyi]|nr:uncharacterized protein LOC117171621 isoform X2 [Belonocnema kinseyi]XP_033214987.1 uncharacterized protein LOC117171621 isoform X2 [Belonocnema kinseyi]
MGEDNMVLSDKQEYNEALVSRIAQLRQVLRDLRLALHLERLNLQREVQSTFARFQKKSQEFQQDLSVNYKDSCQFNIGQVQSFEECDEEKTRLDLISNIEISTANEMHPEFLDQNVSWKTLTSTSNYYKQKIFDLETDCYAGLNKIRYKFMESLQAFEDTLDLAELSYKKREEISNFQDQLTGRKFHRTEESFQRENKILTCLYKSPARCKSLIVHKVQNNWSRNICGERSSDSNFCGLLYRSTQFHQEPSQIFNLTDCISDITISKRYSTLFEPPELSGLQKATIKL